MKKTDHTKKRMLGTEITILTILTSICAILFLGIVLIMLFFFFFSRKTREDIEYILENTNQQFQGKIQFIEDGAVAVRHNVALRDFFQENHYNEKETETQLSYSIDLFSERNMVDQREPFVVSVYLFNRKGQYVREHYYPMTVSAAEDKDRQYEEFYRSFEESGKQYSSMVREGEIDFCFQIYDDEMRKMGVCIVTVYPEAASMLFQGIGIYNGSSWLVTGGRDVLLWGGESGLSEELADIESGFLGDLTLDRRKMLCSSEKCGFGIKATVAVRFSNIYTILKPTIFVFLGAFLIVLTLASAVAFGFGYRFTRPLKEMTEMIHSFGQEDFDVRMGDFSVQEFHDISVVFNEMAERIEHLVTQVYEKELLAARAQVKFLQAQINPHFQFNILAMLSMKAKMAGNEELYQGLSAFAKLMQGKIFRKKEIKIPLEEEIELVKFYLYLQNSRFSEKISYEIRYDSEEVRRDMIPRLLIEPLVENAVSHGLEPKDGNGNILVDIYEEGQELHIIVEDDGVGLEPEDLTARRKMEEESPEEIEHTHTGLENTRRLLHILYGEKCRLELSGKKGEGTRVEIVLPVERSGEDVESDGGR